MGNEKVDPSSRTWGQNSNSTLRSVRNVFISVWTAGTQTNLYFTLSLVVCAVTTHKIISNNISVLLKNYIFSTTLYNVRMCGVFNQQRCCWFVFHFACTNRNGRPAIKGDGSAGVVAVHGQPEKTEAGPRLSRGGRQRGRH